MKKLTILLLFFVLFLFSFFLMFHTFSYDPKTNAMLIATKAWSDFGSHIPLIRSFSLGDNFNRMLASQAPEYPLYPGEPIRYHFLFYALVGLLEKLGVRIDWALNIPSAMGFFFLLLTIWVLAKELFQDTRVAFLSLIFFLFNGSLSFLNFFKLHPLSWNTPLDIITNSRFPSFGPWDAGDITAFWTLNIYTNQRHLGLSFALALTALLVIPGLTRDPSSSKPGFRLGGRNDSLLRGILTAVLFGFLLFANQVAAAVAVLFFVWFFLVNKGARRPLVVAAITAVPFLFLLTRLTTPPAAIAWQPGYLVRQPLTMISFFNFWIANLGLHVLLIPLGFILAPPPIKKLLIVPLALLFLLPNLFRFSPDMINNHKFFNFFLILGNMFSAYAVTKMLDRTGVGSHAGEPTKFCPSSLFGVREPEDFETNFSEDGSKFSLATSGGAPWVVRMATLVGLVGLIFSGVIDLFPVLNDTRGAVADLPANPDARFFADQTPRNAVIANSTWFYHPASLAGRKIFNGYSYFTWSYGYNQGRRESEAIAIYRTQTKREACTLLKQNGIDYVELSKAPEDFLKPNETLWLSLPPAYQNAKTGLAVYRTDTICKQ